MVPHGGARRSVACASTRCRGGEGSRSGFGLPGIGRGQCVGGGIATARVWRGSSPRRSFYRRTGRGRGCRVAVEFGVQAAGACRRATWARPPGWGSGLPVTGVGAAWTRRRARAGGGRKEKASDAGRLCDGPERRREWAGGVGGNGPGGREGRPGWIGPGRRRWAGWVREGEEEKFPFSFWF